MSFSQAAPSSTPIKGFCSRSENINLSLTDVFDKKGQRKALTIMATLLTSTICFMSTKKQISGEIFIGFASSVDRYLANKFESKVESNS